MCVKLIAGREQEAALWEVVAWEDDACVSVLWGRCPSLLLEKSCAIFEKILLID